MRPNVKSVGVVLVLCLAIGVSFDVFAQSVPTQIDPSNLTGVMPYNTYGGVRENINLATGNLNLQIPLVSLPGRDGLDLNLGYVYDSKIWLLHELLTDCCDTFYWDYDKTSGLRLNLPTLVITWVKLTVHPNATIYCAEYPIVILSDGSKHGSFLHMQAGCVRYPDAGGGPIQDPSFNMSTVLDSRDGAFITMDVTNPSDVIVYTKDGHRLHFVLGVGPGNNVQRPVTKIEDANGNMITVSNGSTTTINDSLNRVVTITSTAITYKDSNGTTQTVSLSSGGSQGSPPTFALPTPGGYAHGLGGTFTITLPTGRAYILEKNNYGELTKITYPEGGYTRYDYAVFTADPIGAGPTDFREVVARHVCRDPSGACTVTAPPNPTCVWNSSEDTTCYTPTTNGFAFNQYSDVLDPLQNLTHYQFAATGSGQYFSPREVSRSIYQGSSTLLRTITTDYTNSDPYHNDSLPVRKTTTLYDVTPNLVTKTEWDYDTYTETAQDVVPIDNAVTQREYDYGSGAAPTTPIRQTVRTWLKVNSVNGQNYMNNSIHIFDRKLTENTQDNGGNNAAQTKYEYDNYGTISASGATQHNSAFGTTYTTRGNATKIQRWRNTDGAWLTTTNTYDDAGNVLGTTAPSNSPYDSFTRTTSFSYVDSWGNTACTPIGGNGAAYITSVTNPKQQVTHYAYNSCSGTTASATDADSQATTFSYDLLDRLTQTAYPDTGQTSDCYSDTTGASCYSTGQMFFTRTDRITGSISKSRKISFDGVANVTQTQLTTDPDGIVSTDITYDGLGRKISISNPHRATSSSTDGTTQYTYDPLNRVTVVTQPDGSQVLTNYAGNQTTVTDEAGKQRKNQTDGLGRVTTVWEDPSVLNYETDYQYNVLGNLIRVDQKGGDPNAANWRTRTFAYNSLSQLLCAANPEIAIVTCPNPDSGGYTTGTIRFGYDNEGNVVTKMAPKPNQTASATVVITYSYDALNRLTQKGYNDNTPTAKYGYDGVALSGCTTAPPALTDSYPVGRRTTMCDGSGATSWSHEKMGRVATESRTIAGSTNLTKSVTYAPYLDGSLATLTYPSGRTITYGPGGAGRPLSVVETAQSINYVTNAHYAPPGSLSEFQDGAAINGRLTYNSRLQLQQTYYTSGTVPTPDQLQLTCPTTAATIMSRLYNFGSGTNDNGNVHSITDCLVTNRTQNLDYDRLNRLADAYTTGTSTSATNWGEVYTIDPWGNLTNIALKSGWHNSESLNAAAASAQNHLNGFCYDSAGNMTGTISCPSSSYTYDAENRLTATAGYTYRYDGDGKRVIKCNGTYPTCSSGTLYWTGTGSEALAETNWTGAAVEEYVFFAGMRVARRDGTGNTVKYYFSDHLGSATVVTSAIGTIQKSSMYYPYGGEIAITGPSFANNYKFTGKERDTESILDYLGARYHSSSLGRFMTPDEFWKDSHIGDPQSWNEYAYVRNNPLRYIDPSGEGAMDGSCYADGDSCGTAGGGSQGQQQSQQQQGQQQLSVADVSKIIQQAQKSSSDPATIAFNIFNSLGNNASVTGEILRAAIKATGVKLEGAAADLISHADSITKSGNAVTVTSNSRYDTSQNGTTIHVDSKVSFTVGMDKGLPGINNIKGLHAEVGVNASVDKMQVAMKGDQKVLLVTGSKAFFHKTIEVPLE